MKLAGEQHRLSNSSYGYYYSTLSIRQKRCYDKLLNGYLHHKKRITVEVDNKEEISIVNQAILNDTPELFYFTNYKYIYYKSQRAAKVDPIYLLNPSRSNQIRNEINSNIDNIVKQCSNKSDFEKVKIIHDFLLAHIKYGEQANSHSIVGALVDHYAVCEGISKAFKYIADLTGLQSIIVYGNAINSSANMMQSHSWNQVFVDGKNYHIDVTFDLTISALTGIRRYDYFLLSDAQINNDHFFGSIPICSNPFEYYIANGLYAENKSRLKAILTNRMQAEDIIVVKMPDFKNGNHIIVQAVLDIASEVIDKISMTSKDITVEYNGSRMIFGIKVSGVS